MKIKKVVVPCKYREVSIQDDGYGTLELELDGSPNFITENGELRYEEVTKVEDSNFYIAEQDGKYGVLNHAEQEGEINTVSMAESMYQIDVGENKTEIRDFRGKIIRSGNLGEVALRLDGCIVADNGDAFGHDLFNRNGERILLQKDEVGELDYFSSVVVDEAIIYNREKDDEYRYGMVSMTGEEIFPCVYNSLYYVPEKEVYFYSKDGRSGMMDKNRNIVWEKEYDGIWIYIS